MEHNTERRTYPVRKNGRFFNDQHEHYESIIYNAYKMFVDGVRASRSGYSTVQAWNERLIIPATSLEHSAKTLAGELIWIGHATFLIQVGGYSVLTDPVFGDVTFFFKRLHRPGIALELLPPVDAVLISHNHRDHMDRLTLQSLAKANPLCTFFAPLGDKQRLLSWGIQNVVACNWWEQQTVGKLEKGLKLTFLPAKHWSGRNIFDRNKSLWGSWMIEHDEYRVYFAGDTASGDHFGTIANEFPLCDVALLPIGPCEPRSWMSKHHLSAEEAGEAFLDLQARIMVPMHWGTFGFGVDSPLLPLERLQAWWKRRLVATERMLLSIPKIGERISLHRS